MRTFNFLFGCCTVRSTQMTAISQGRISVSCLTVLRCKYFHVLCNLTTEVIQNSLTGTEKSNLKCNGQVPCEQMSKRAFPESPKLLGPISRIHTVSGK